jgi:hypothetical protein
MSDVDLKFCWKHQSTRPCQKCLLAQCGGNQAELAAKTLDGLLGIGAAVLAEWRPMAAAAGIRPDQKCDHGVYLAQHYCNVCAWLIIEPGYNPEVYRTEINKALGVSKRLLLHGTKIKSTTKATKCYSESRKDFEDLVRVIDIEIWKTVKKYGDKMTPGLAYTVAKNQVGRFLAERIEEQTVVVEDAEGNPVLDELGVADGLDGGDLKRRANDTNLGAEERRRAKELLQLYQVRVPRFVESMDDRPLDDDGDEMPTISEIYAATAPLSEGWLDAEMAERDVEHFRRLVSTWYGVKRKVGERMLQPGFTTRSVPGVSQNVVQRIKPEIIRAFKAFKDKELQNS